MGSLPRPQDIVSTTPPLPSYRAVYYRKHGRKCSASSHRTWKTLGKCLWPEAAWVMGVGEWASVAYCRVTTVMLWPTEQDARAGLEFIDMTGCGGRCGRLHALVRIAPHLHPVTT